VHFAVTLAGDTSKHSIALDAARVDSFSVEFLTYIHPGDILAQSSVKSAQI
jgi:hypothetical protein